MQSEVYFTVVDGTLVILVSAVHKVVIYYRRPKRSVNKIQLLETKFKFVKKRI